MNNLLEHNFNTKFGIITTGLKASIEDVHRYFLYRDDFNRTLNTFRFSLPNQGKDATILSANALFSKDLLKEFEIEYKKRRIQDIKNKINSLKDELKVIEDDKRK